MLAHAYTLTADLNSDHPVRSFAKKNIKHELASAHNPESNGLAEAAVESIKPFVINTAKEEQTLNRVLAAWRNMAILDGISPSKLFFYQATQENAPNVNNCIGYVYTAFREATSV